MGCGVNDAKNAKWDGRSGAMSARLRSPSQRFAVLDEVSESGRGGRVRVPCSKIGEGGLPQSRYSSTTS